MSEFSVQGYSDADAVDATDGSIDADTVDGQEAADLGAPASTQSAGGSGGWVDAASLNKGDDVYEGFSWTDGPVYIDGVRVSWDSGDRVERIRVYDLEGNVAEDYQSTETGGSYTFNFTGLEATQVTVDVNDAGTYSFDIHVVQLPAHSHNI